MRKRSLLMLGGSICLILIMAITACAAPTSPTLTPTPTPTTTPTTPPPAEVIHWRMQAYMAPLYDPVFAEFCDKIKQNTDGRIEIEHFGAGTLVPNTEIFSATGEGTIDMGYTWGGYHCGILPEAEVEAGLPMAWGSVAQPLNFHFTLNAREILREAYAEHNIYWVTPALHSAYFIAAPKPFTTIEEAKDLKFRCTAPVGELLDKFGISSVYLPSEELYTGLATGIIDAVIYGSDATYYSMKLYEIAPYIVDIKLLNPITGGIGVNLDAWNALPEDLKGIIEDTTTNQFTLAMWSYISYNRMETHKTGVFTYVDLVPEDVKALTEAATKKWDEVATINLRCAELIEMLKEVNRQAGRL